MPEKSSNRLKIGFGILFFVIFAGAGGIYLSGILNRKTIKIGVIIPMSGPASHLVVLKEGLELSVDAVNTEGGVNGRELELIVRDSRSDPLEAVRLFNEIELKHQPLFYITATSAVALSLAPLAEQYKVVIAGLAVSSPRFTQQNSWVFQYYLSSIDEAKSIAGILSTKKISSIAVFFQDDEFGQSVNRAFDRIYRAPGRIISSEPIQLQDQDIQHQIQAHLKMEAVYVAGFPSFVDTLVGQIKATGYGGLILATSGIPLLEHNDGVYTAAPIIYNTNYVFHHKIKAEYEHRYRKEFFHQAASGYDFITLITNLLTENDLNSQTVKTALNSGFSHNGILGSFTVPPGTQDIFFPLFPARIKRGKLEFLNQIY